MIHITSNGLITLTIQLKDILLFFGGYCCCYLILYTQGRILGTDTFFDPDKVI